MHARSVFVAITSGFILAGCSQVDVPQAPPTPGCDPCVEWNRPHEPVLIFGNSYWVGTEGLGAILITSDEGHVLIDGGLAESARQIAENIHALGFDLRDVRLILNSHVHYDHAGGIAALQEASGAEVAASPWSATVLQTGYSSADDPQHGVLFPIDPVPQVRTVEDGEVLHVGPIEVTAHFTPGHTPGGTTWSWRSCEEDRCLDLVYGDSQTPVSADGFYFSRNDTYPHVVQDFERSFAVFESLRCDILITPHPGASNFWDRLERGREATDGLIDGNGCKRYAESARQALARRIAQEQVELTTP